MPTWAARMSALCNAGTSGLMLEGKKIAATANRPAATGIITALTARCPCQRSKTRENSRMPAERATVYSHILDQGARAAASHLQKREAIKNASAAEAAAVASRPSHSGGRSREATVNPPAAGYVLAGRSTMRA